MISTDIDVLYPDRWDKAVRIIHNCACASLAVVKWLVVLEVSKRVKIHFLAIGVTSLLIPCKVFNPVAFHVACAVETKVCDETRPDDFSGHFAAVKIIANLDKHTSKSRAITHLYGFFALPV